jgi:membrane AbrB-like protein
VPAALLLGPIVAGIVIATARGSLAIPQWPFLFAQGAVGSMIASRFSPSLVSSIGGDWILYLVVTACVLAASSLIGWTLARWHVLPGTTAVWGTSPGAATAMIVMAEAYGADSRLVAFMQYLRVVLVASLAPAVAHFGAPHVATAATSLWFAPIHGIRFAETLALVFGGAAAGRVLAIPAGGLLVPFAVGSVLNVAGLLKPELPPWFLAASYALIGWKVGLRFTRDILAYAARVLPRVLASTLTLIGVCGLIAVALTHFVGIDLLTAYLATSPGGADSVAIIAASSGKVNFAFVMALQMVRAVTVLFIGPPLAKFIASHTGDRQQGE